MSSRGNRNGRKKQRGSTAGALCRLFGMLILLAVIAACLPVTVPRYLGYEVFHIVSGSMEPSIPVGSVIYVEPIAPDAVIRGDIIAFNSGDSVIAHRVVTNQVVEGYYTTKGDANDGEDLSDVKYSQLIGRVVYHIPILGQLLMILGTTVGKVYVICFAACGALLNIIATRLNNS